MQFLFYTRLWAVSKMFLCGFYYIRKLASFSDAKLVSYFSVCGFIVMFYFLWRLGHLLAKTCCCEMFILNV